MLGVTVALVDWPANCCACSSALTWVRISSRSSEDSPADDSRGAAGVDDGGGSCWEEVEPAAAVLAEDQADRRTVAVEGPAARHTVERRVDLGLGMFTSR